MNGYSILEQLGLTNQEENVLLHLLTIGQLTKGEISDGLNIPYKELETTIDKLVQRNFVTEIPGMAEPKYAAHYPLDGIKKGLQQGVDRLNSLGKDLDNYIEVRANEIKHDIDYLKESVDVKLDNTKSDIFEKRKITSEAIEVKKTRADNSVDNVNVLAQSQVDLIAYEYAEGVKQLAIEFESLINDRIQSTNQVLGNLIESLGINVQDHAGSIAFFEEQHQENLSEIVKGTIATPVSAIRGQVSDLVGDIKGLATTIREQGRDINRYLENVKSDLETRRQRYKTTLELTRGGVEEQAAKTIEVTRKELEKSSSRINSAIREFLEKEFEYDSGSQLVKERRWLFFTRIIDRSGEFEKIKAKVNGLVEGQNHLLVKSVEDFLTSTTNSINKMSVDISSNIDKTVLEITNRLTKYQQKLEEQINSMDSNGKITITEIKTIENNLLESFKSLQQDVDEISKRELEKVKTTLQSITEKVDNSVQDTVKETLKEGEILRNTLHEQVRLLLAKNDDSKNEFIVSTKLAIETAQLLLRKSVGNLSDFSLKKFEEMEKTLAIRVEELKKYLHPDFARNVDTVKSSMKDYSNKFKEQTTGLNAVLKEQEIAVSELKEKILATETPDVDTAYIIGKKAILNYIEIMIQRMKSSLTLVIPDPVDIPVQAIKDSKPHHRISVVSSFDLD
ncbi:MAG: helix-turn-helix domain-containing protein, partial [Candidatus Hodarchaeales archaeon]